MTRIYTDETGDFETAKYTKYAKREEGPAHCALRDCTGMKKGTVERLRRAMDGAETGRESLNLRNPWYLVLFAFLVRCFPAPK
jgi:hypothetical protein